MANAELEVKTRLAAILWVEGVPCQPHEMELSVKKDYEWLEYGGQHHKVVVILPDGVEYTFDHFQGHGFPERDDAALPPEVEEWLSEQARTQGDDDVNAAIIKSMLDGDDSIPVPSPWGYTGI